MISGKLKYLNAYRHVLIKQESIDMWFIKVIFLGAPRLGKTTARRRLGGEIADISSSGEAVQPSTGIVESGVVIRNLSSNTALVTPSHWSISKNLPEEANITLHFLYHHTLRRKAISTNKGSRDSHAKTDTASTKNGNEGLPDSHAKTDIASTINGNEGMPDSHAKTDIASTKNGNEGFPDSHAKTDTDPTNNGSEGLPDSHAKTGTDPTKNGGEGLPDSHAKTGTDPPKNGREGLPDSHAKNPTKNGNESLPDSNVEAAASPILSKSLIESSDSPKVVSEIIQSETMSELAEFFRKAVSPEDWKDIKHLFKDTALLKMEDAGGQPELMDMLAALTIGPALYLLFCKLIDDLHSNYTVSYVRQSGESTTPVQSTYTMEETLLTALASVSCFRYYSTTSLMGSEESSSAPGDELLASCNKSVAYILGTHKDLVSEEEVENFDEKLQNSIRSTDFFRKDLVQFSSENRMVLPIDNMHGGEDEIKKVRQFLEEGMKKHFKKLSIPASWLILSLCLRKRELEERTASLQSVLQLAGELGMSEREAKLALWFLHHYAGVLMYFPNLKELKDTVICDTQVVYDSTTNLIVNTFKFESVGKAASERFRETGQFSLEDIRGATTQVSGDYITLQKLVKLLEHLNIIVIIAPSLTSSKSSEVSYFMPCVLQNVTHKELDKWWERNSSPHSPAPLFIRYDCGFSLIGVFPAMIANLAGIDSLQLVVDGIKKNRVQFRMIGGDYDTFTLISHPKYYAVHITREPDAKTPTHEVCSTVRGIVESTLKVVTSKMNYSFCAEYHLSFECPSHPGRDHLCTVEKCKMSTPRSKL